MCLKIEGSDVIFAFTVTLSEALLKQEGQTAPKALTWDTHQVSVTGHTWNKVAPQPLQSSLIDWIRLSYFSGESSSDRSCKLILNHDHWFQKFFKNILYSNIRKTSPGPWQPMHISKNTSRKEISSFTKGDFRVLGQTHRLSHEISELKPKEINFGWQLAH